MTWRDAGACMRRLKAEVLQHFEAGLREADVPGTGWATAAEAAAAEADVDALIADATQRRARFYSVHVPVPGMSCALAGRRAPGAVRHVGWLALEVTGHLGHAGTWYVEQARRAHAGGGGDSICGEGAHASPDRAGHCAAGELPRRPVAAPGAPAGRRLAQRLAGGAPR